jgi:hypothetical protein
MNTEMFQEAQQQMLAAEELRKQSEADPANATLVLEFEQAFAAASDAVTAAIDAEEGI